MTPATTRTEILDGIYEIFRSTLDYEGELSPGLDLIDADLDSMLILQLVVEVEDRFHVAIDEGDEAGILTIGDLADVVEKHRAA